MYAPNAKRPRLRAGLSRPTSQQKPSAPQPPKQLQQQGTPNEISPPPLPSRQLLKQPSRKPLHALQQKQNQPLVPLAPKTSSLTPSAKPASNTRQYFSVMYTKRSRKKRKSWLDGYVVLTNDRALQLLNDEGKPVSADRFSGAVGGLREGNSIEIASWELEVQGPIREEDFVSGRIFIPPAPTKRETPASIVPRPAQRLLRRPPAPNSMPPSTLRDAEAKRMAPLHDPNAEGACTLLPSVPISGKQSAPIVLDPFLGKRMRPHQRDGVRFLFDCTAGKRIRDGDGPEGAILADDMGLGKSLQAIALIWTLLKQGPFGAPLAKKAIIVCPASLVRNWQNEVRKWLGDERLRPVAVESGSSSYESKAEMASFLNGNVRRLLIISYETFRTQAKDLYTSGCGLVVCDEGHRLKSVGGNKTVDALRGLPCRRRVILTGTPVQNDLEEFFAVCDFVVPGCFNSLTSFRSVFASPILDSRDSRASNSAKQLGEARAKELGRITSAFVLRRTSNILEKYLPPKQETAVFCRLTEAQENAYEDETKQRRRDLFGSSMSHASLSAIMILRKICSHPHLVNKGKIGGTYIEDDDNDDFDDAPSEAKEEKVEPPQVSDSVKMVVALSICEKSIARKDRVVVVSNFTSSLDLLEGALKTNSISFCRLDGSTAVSGRGDIVRRFNDGSLGDVFLLSAKAGGVGLNLIGANRLILFDPDWNPATDAQAMARVWRDGQKKNVFVYRLLCTGTIEEKIFQRQLFKRELHYAVDGDEQGRDGLKDGQDGNFNKEELMDIFRYNPDVKYCETLNVLQRSHTDWDGDEDIPRGRLLLEQFLVFKRKAELQGNIENYVWCDSDETLEKALNANPQTHGLVSYLFTKKTNNSGGEVEVGKCEKSSESRKRKSVSDQEGQNVATVEGTESEPEVVEECGDTEGTEVDEAGYVEATDKTSNVMDGSAPEDSGKVGLSSAGVTWDDVVDDLDDIDAGDVFVE